jgi:hypothetical protein
MRLLKLLLCATTAALAGCGGSEQQAQHPAVAPTAGTVTYNGSPVAGATVTLFSDTTKEKGWTLAAQTDAEGKFEIMSRFAPGTEFKGAPAGDYTIVVTKFETPAAAAPKDLTAYEEQFKKQQQAAASGARPEVTAAKASIPTKYSQDGTSPLKVKIEAAGNSDIEVTLED